MPNLLPNPLLVDRVEACRLLGGISGSTLDRMRRAGAFPAVQTGGRILFDPVDLTAWRDSQKRSAWDNPAPAAAIAARRNAND